MASLTGVNVFLMAMDSSDSFKVSKVYFEVVSILVTAFPIIWSKILDECKAYVDDLTPNNSPTLSDEKDDSLRDDGSVQSLPSTNDHEDISISGSGQQCPRC